MATVPFAVYDAFSDVLFGGSQACIVSGAVSFDAGLRERIAKEIGMPATGFIESCSANTVSARFLSTVMELPMCGHGTICLMSRLVELGDLAWDGIDRTCVELVLPSGTATVELGKRSDNRPQVMLDIASPSFRQDDVDVDELAGLLGLAIDDFNQDWPLETACADFTHLVVPLRGLAAMRRIKPNFPGIIDFCNGHGIETVAAFCTEVDLPGSTIHVRDFCPAVGVWESSSAGTTNGALASYLMRHGIVAGNSDGLMVIRAEQGHEINRPSSIRSVASIRDGEIIRLQVGGVATKVMDGQLYLPD